MADVEVQAHQPKPTANQSRRGRGGGSGGARHHGQRHNNSDSHRGRNAPEDSGGVSRSGGGRDHRSGRDIKHNTSVDMRKYEKMIGAAQDNFCDILLDSGRTEDCTICCKPNDLFGVGECKHPICVECAIRLRILEQKTCCPVCRAEIEKLSFCYLPSDWSTANIKFPSSGHPDEERYKIAFENKGAGVRYEKYLSHVCKICKGEDGERLEFATFLSLRQHMAQTHHMSFCHICTENLVLFSRERKCYSRDALNRHTRCGDVEDRSQKGHPKCLFCEQRFFDDHARYIHLRKEHFFCQFCELEGTAHNVFFGKHTELIAHYSEKHYVCEVEECKSMGIAFANEFDLKVHKSREHADKLKMQLDFRFNDRQPQSRQPRRYQEPPQPLPQQQSRIALVPSEPVQVQRSTDEFVVVPSAQSRNPNARYRIAPAYVPQVQDFPTLGGMPGMAPAPPAPPPNVRSTDFPRLPKATKPAKPAHAAVASKGKKQEKSPTEDFPSLGGGPSRAPTTAAPAPPNWTAPAPTPRYEMIDVDEMAASRSVSARAPPPAAVQQKKPQPRVQAIPTEEYPSLPAPAAPNNISRSSAWGKKGKPGVAITGISVPRGYGISKKVPEPDIWPGQQAQSSKPYEPPTEEWQDIPETKATKKANMKKEKQERKKQQVQTSRRPSGSAPVDVPETSATEGLRGPATPPPADPVEEPWSEVPVTETKKGGKKRNKVERIVINLDSIQPKQVKPEETVWNGTPISDVKPTPAPAIEEPKKSASKESLKEKTAEQPELATPAVVALDSPTALLKDNEFPELMAKLAAHTGKKPEEVTTPTDQQGGSLFGSISSMFSGLSLSNVFGSSATSKPLGSCSAGTPISPQKPSTPISNGSFAPPGIGVSNAPPSLDSSSVLFSPPPGFESVRPLASVSHERVNAPPGLMDFSSVPMFSADDIKRATPEPKEAKPDPDGWMMNPKGRRK